jgi:YHS domain-containing protein
MALRINNIRMFCSILIAGGLLTLNSVSIFAADEPTQKIVGVAIKGYDPVAYFTENRAVKGSKENSYNWHEATWYFSSPENRDLFAANPERYAPQFGGYCVTGVSKGKLLKADPEQWTIVDEKLYLNYDRSARDILRQHKADMITEAEKNWVNLKK